LSENVLGNGLAWHMLVCVCSLGSKLNVHAKPKKLMPSRDTIGF